jgi:hypothetical protein
VYIPVWILFFFVPGAWAAFSAVLPWLIGLLVLFIVYAVLSESCVWIEHLLTRAAKALPACWLFDGSPGPPTPPILDPKASALPREPVGGWNWRNDDTDYPSGRH